MNGSKYTVDNIPVKSIINGMIHLDSKEKVTGVKIEPRNIFILGQDAVVNIISNLKNVYNMIDYEFWLIVADRPVDITVYLSKLEVLYNDTTDLVKKRLILDDINKGNMFIENNVVDTEYFIIFKDKSDELIQKRIRNLINSLSTSGLSSSQTSNDDLRTILDNFLNGGQTTNFGTVMIG